MSSLIGRKVHVSGHGPNGWDGRVRSLTGSTYVIADSRGVRHHVDYTRRTVVAL